MSNLKSRKFSWFSGVVKILFFQHIFLFQAVHPLWSFGNPRWAPRSWGCFFFVFLVRSSFSLSYNQVTFFLSFTSQWKNCVHLVLKLQLVFFFLEPSLYSALVHFHLPSPFRSAGASDVRLVWFGAASLAQESNPGPSCCEARVQTASWSPTSTRDARILLLSSYMDIWILKTPGCSWWKWHHPCDIIRWSQAFWDSMKLKHTYIRAGLNKEGKVDLA